ncbi:MAG: hypothetical protein R3249_08635 [Nitriliruptorales bacterium]|nr:hypothetical protein [Nitriliruptorales bacterium]
MTDIERIARVAGLPAAELAFLEELDPTEVARLADRVEAVGPERDQAVDAGIEGALKMVPRMLRPAIRKVLFAGAR